MDHERNQDAAELRWIVLGCKIVTVAVFSLRLFVVGLALWGVSTGRASVSAVASVGDGLFGIMFLAYCVELVIALLLLTSPDPFATRFQLSLAILVAMLSIGLAGSLAGWLIPNSGLPRTPVSGMALPAMYVTYALLTLRVLRKHANAGAPS